MAEEPGPAPLWQLGEPAYSGWNAPRRLGVLAMRTIEALYFGDVSSKIENAHRLHREFGARLRADRKIQRSLNHLVQLEKKLAEAMRSMGMFEFCAECGGQPAGGCCSAKMANETDSMLLLINLSAGFEVSRKRDDGYECCFLGPEGCSLKFKPFCCLNYLCRQIYTKGSASQIACIQGATAELLGQLVAAEELLRQQLLAE
jgi:hypothetical protein